MNNFVIYTDAEGKEQTRAMTPEELDEFEKRIERTKEIIRKYHGDFDSYQITGKEGYVVRIRAGKYMREPIAEEALAEIEKMETLPAAREETALIRETGKTVTEMMTAVRAMGEMLRIMGERMTAMEKTIRTLEKVSPGQAAEINRGIRERAAEICQEYGIDAEARKPIVAAIRKDVREMTGVRTAREIARCDRDAVMAFIRTWEDYDRILNIRKGAGK